MADISISLVIEDAQFQAALLKAITSTQKLEAAVKQGGETAKKNHDQTVSGLEKVAHATELLQKKMEGLNTVLLGAGFLEFAKHALEATKSIAEIAEANDMTIPRLQQLRDAFTTNGGSAEKLGQILAKLNQNLQGARDGSAKAQEDLLKLGFTFKDMANLNTDEALQKVINKLASMEDPVKRNALAFETLGKGARNINWAGIAAGTATASDEYNKYAESLRKGQEAADKLELASEKLRVAFVNFLDRTGILDKINNLDQSMDKFATVVKIAGTAFELYFGAKVLSMAVQGWKDLAFAIGLADVALSKIGTTASAAGAILGKVSLALYLLFHSEDLNAGEDEQIKKIHKFQDALQALGPKAVAAYMAMSDAQKKQIQTMFEQGKALDEAMNISQGKPASGGGKPAVTAAWQGEVNAILSRAQAFRNLIEAQRGQYEMETNLIGKSQEQTESQKRLTELAFKYRDEVLKLVEEEKKITGTTEADKDKRAAYEKAIQQLGTIYNLEVDGERKAGEQRQNALKQLDEYMSKISLIAEEERRNFELLKKKAEATLSPRQLADEEIRLKNQEKMNQLLREEAVHQFGPEAVASGAKLEETSKEYQKIKKDIDRATEAEIDFQHQINKIQDSMANGLVKSINTFVEQADNGTMQVGKIFDDMTKGLEDAFINWAKTGKMSMGDLFNSMLEDFIRMEIRMMESQVFKWLAGDTSGGGTVGSGVLSSLGKLLGFADGGIIPTNAPVLVGERGPELLTNAAGMNVVPNEQLQGGGDTHIHNYNIQAVDAKSVAQLFADNRMTMFGMVEQARRELPMRTR
jgi:lambda family phage tail tape measure protein